MKYGLSVSTILGLLLSRPSFISEDRLQLYTIHCVSNLWLATDKSKQFSSTNDSNSECTYRWYRICNNNPIESQCKTYADVPASLCTYYIPRHVGKRVVKSRVALNITPTRIHHFNYGVIFGCIALKCVGDFHYINPYDWTNIFPRRILRD